jgi:hypothetical protein
MLRVRNLIFPIGLVTALMTPLHGAEMTCMPSGVHVEATRSEDADRVCEAVQVAQSVFDGCGLPGVPSGLRINVVENLRHGCVALYHCGENWIETLAPDAMQKRRLPGSAFEWLDIEDYFRSVVVHELAHAVFDELPCPFEACVAAAEYISYALQVMSLTPKQQKTFEERAALDRKISRDELNAMYLFMAPSKFAQKAWTHVSQREDPCAFLGQVIDGTVLFDREPL